MTGAEAAAQLRSVVCVIRAVVRFVEINDHARVRVRAELRDALAAIERPELRQSTKAGSLP
jgi:hypothetical protein